MKRYVSIMSVLVTLCLISCSSENNACPDTNCSDYATQQEAQAAFNADPECHKDLDRDKDGIACE